MSKQSAVSFVPSEGLEQELDNVVVKLKNELKKMNLRIKDLERTLESKEEENKAIIVQNENRLKALSDEMNTNQELLKQKEKEITILKEKSLKDNIYHQNMIKENEEHIKRLEDDIQSMNNDIKELNLEHSKQSEKLKFNLNETKLELKKKTNAERVRINEFEYKFDKLQTENDELVHSLESTVTSLRSENEKRTEILKAENDDLKSKLEVENSLRTTVDKLRKDTKTLESEIARHRTYIRINLKPEIDRLKEDNKTLQNENVQWKNDVEALTWQKLKCEKELKDVSEELRGYQAGYKKTMIEFESISRNNDVTIEHLSVKNTKLNNEKSILSKENANLRFTVQTQLESLHSLSSDKASIETEKQNLLLWLNKPACANLTYNNPNIADLSDEKRPTKLSEEFSELYDNEWTDAFEDVNIEGEKEKTTFMLNLLKRINEMCHELSSEHMKNIKKSICTLAIRVNNPYSSADRSILTSPIEGHESDDTDHPQMNIDVNVGIVESSDGEVPGRLKTVSKLKLKSDFELLKNEQKETIFEARQFLEFQLSADVRKAVTDIIVQEKGINKEKQQSVMTYIAKCVDISWSMCRHEPPVYIDFVDVSDDIVFDTNKYKPYTQIGRHLAYVVWPALYLHESGPMLSKGVAQGK